MPKHVAIDWNPSAARYVVAEVTRGSVRVLHAGAIDCDQLPTDAERLESVAQLLAKKLKQAGASGATATMAVGRSDVDIYRFALPPATDDELATLVQTQVFSQAGASTGEPVIDFFAQADDLAKNRSRNRAEPLPQPSGNEATNCSGNGSNSRPVEAVVTSQEKVAQYRAFGSTAGIRLKRLVVRPYATAALLRPMGSDLPAAVLIVSMLGSEVDLILASASQVLFWRTVQLSEDARTPIEETLVSEITRTLAVAPTHLPDDRRVERIILCGSDDENTALTSSLADQTGLNVHALDATVIDGISGAEVFPEPGRSAPLLGMLLGEAAGDTPAIDLLHPRQPAKPPNRWRTWSLAAAAAAVALILGGTFGLADVEEEKEKTRELAKDLIKLRRIEKKLAADVAVAQSIGDWEQGNVVWLDELRDLSTKFPAAQDVVVRGMTIRPPRRGGGARIDIHGLVRIPSVIHQLDLDLRIEGVRIATSTKYREQPGGTESALDWRFETQIATQRRPVESYRAEKTAAPDTPRSAPLPADIPAGKRDSADERT